MLWLRVAAQHWDLCIAAAAAAAGINHFLFEYLYRRNWISLVYNHFRCSKQPISLKFPLAVFLWWLLSYVVNIGVKCIASQEDPLIPVRSPLTSSIDNSNGFWVDRNGLWILRSFHPCFFCIFIDLFLVRNRFPVIRTEETVVHLINNVVFIAKFGRLMVVSVSQ